MGCQRCSSDRVASVGAKSSDLSIVSMKNAELDGYMPDDLGIGGGDYVEFEYCLDCGQIQGEFPLPETKLDLEVSNYEERKLEHEQKSKNFNPDEFFNNR